jgi:hypothetical protein
MSRSRICAILCVVSIFGARAAQSQQAIVDSQNKAPTSTRPDRLTTAVQRAKAAGESRIELPGPVIMQTGVTNAVELIKNYSILHFSVAESVETIDSAGDIRTWYKLKLLERINIQPQIAAGDLLGDVPPPLLPVRDDETIYTTTAGTVVIDGVTVVQSPSERGLVLEKGREYVGAFYLLLGGRHAKLAVASASLYAVINDDLKPQADEEDGLVKDVRRHFGARLSTFRAAVRRMMGSPK